MLYIVSTPIGHLDDISKRSIDTLKQVDLILCEDTRRSSILLKHYFVQTKCISYHKFNEKKLLNDILSDLESGKTIALISDAGTPCINDPGSFLTQKCIEKKIPFTLIPGPCSIIQALVLSGMDTTRFQFLGFFPKNGLQKTINQVLAYPGTTIAFESPNRLLNTLKKLRPHSKVAVLREMTKVYEEALRGTAESLIKHFEKEKPKGEIVLAISGDSSYEDLSLEETIKLLQELHGLSLKEAIKSAAKIQKISKRDAYQKMHDN